MRKKDKDIINVKGQGQKARQSRAPAIHLVTQGKARQTKATKGDERQRQGKTRSYNEDKDKTLQRKAR